jgi:endonuclease/exonuclease/phosphatase family metal-dependent hydrolase
MVFSRIPDRESTNSNGLRVLTRNIYNVAAKWERRRPVLADGMRAISPDLIALQETVLAGGFDQAADLLGGSHEIVNSRARLPGGWGASIASRWPIREVRELDQQVTPRAEEWCTTLIAEIEAPPPIGPLIFVNHFQSAAVGGEHERELQAVAVARCVEEMVAGGERHVILAGDLNAGPDAASIRFLTGKQSLDGKAVCYLNCWDLMHPGEPGETFTPRSPLVAAEHREWPHHRLDHILVRFGHGGSPTLDTVACELAFNEPINGVWASDHFAVVADLDVPVAS